MMSHLQIDGCTLAAMSARGQGFIFFCPKRRMNPCAPEILGVILPWVGPTHTAVARGVCRHWWHLIHERCMLVLSTAPAGAWG